MKWTEPANLEGSWLAAPWSYRRWAIKPLSTCRPKALQTTPPVNRDRQVIQSRPAMVLDSLTWNIGNSKSMHLTWWTYALLSAACWGMQYLLLEMLFGQVEFAAAFSFLSLFNGVLVALIMFVIRPNQDWSQLWQSWSVVGMVVLYLLCGSGAYVFNAYAIHRKNATLASLLEIAYPLFIILFTGLFLRKVHLNAMGFAGALLILGGSVLVVLSRSK